MVTARRYSFVLCLLALVWLTAPGQSFAQAPARAASIYDFLRANVDPLTGRLNAAAATLPDEPQWRKYSRFRTAPGALEGMGTHHVQWAGSEKAPKVAELLVEIAAGSPVAEQALLELLRADDVHTYYSKAIESASRQLNPDEPRLREFALRLATQASERGQVKFGIALLGAIADPSDLGIILTLGLHDELGLYVAEALTELTPEPQRALWQMARHVTGWGRIHAVERMTRTNDAELSRWLLTEGFRNSVSSQYLAYHCAVIADLKGALAAKRVDRPTLIGAADLLRALAESDQARNLSNFPDAAEASTLFLKQVARRRDSLSYFLSAHALLDFARKSPAETSAPDSEIGSSAQREQVARMSERIVNDRVWSAQVRKVAADDRADLQQAELAAQRLGVDTFDVHVRRLAANSALEQRWTLAFRTAGSARVAAVVAIAERRFAQRLARFDELRERGRADPLNAEEIGALEAVLQGLSQYPAVGTSLVSPSITYPDSRVRRAAVDALVRWGGGFAARSNSIRNRLSTAARVESDEGLQARMVALLNSD